MKKITLNRNGQTTADDVEISDLKAGAAKPTVTAWRQPWTRLQKQKR